MHLERTESFRIPPARLWAFIANTDSLNREVGLPPVTFAFVPVRPGRASVKARARLLGMTLEWDEAPFEWMWSKFLSVRRAYSRGPMKDLRIAWTLAAEADVTRLTITMDGTPRGPISRWLAALPMRSTLNRMFEAVAAFEIRSSGPAEVPEAGRSVVRAVNRSVLDSASRRLAGAPVDPAHVRLLTRLLEEEADERVSKIRPFELADAWGFDRAEALRLCLHATRAGLLALKWSVVCPRCHGVKARKDSLRELEPKQTCESCAISFDVDLDQRVEVVFAPDASIREIATATYCFGGPMNTPHIVAQVNLAGGEARGVDLALPEGAYKVGWDGPGDAVPLIVGPGLDSVEVEVGTAPPEPLSIAPGGRLTLRNGSTAPVRAFVERRDSAGARATAARVMSMAEFRGLFDAEALADGVELSVGAVTLLFSDLKGSTAMYERVGDAPAWGRVKRHFDFMAGAIALHHGAIVKTMGDAVMAVFPDPADAVRCGVGIQGANHGSENAIKIGIHFGPCLAVTADGRLDYFGSTVNLAQRTQSQSGGGDVVISDAVRRAAGMDDLLTQLGAVSTPFTAELKGVNGPAVLHRLAILKPDGGKTSR